MNKNQKVYPPSLSENPTITRLLEGGMGVFLRLKYRILGFPNFCHFSTGITFPGQAMIKQDEEY